MGKLKSVESTVLRIIGKVESGDYDEATLIHMVQSIIDNRDRRIKHLEDKNRPREFIITERKITGALRNTIKEHGDITNKSIGSAAKRVYRSCIELENDPPETEKDPNASIIVIRDKNKTHKLTVASDGNIRIKIAIGTSNEDANRIIEGFVNVAVEAQQLNETTLRGKINLNKNHDSITLYTDSKNKHFTYKY